VPTSSIGYEVISQTFLNLQTEYNREGRWKKKKEANEDMLNTNI
jgi:hypothetical protein